MKTVNNIHDALFRQTMSHKDVAADFLRTYLPAGVVRHLQLDTLAIAKDTFVASDQRMHYSDLLYTVGLHGGRPAFVYFLFEHKSRPDRFVSLQLLRYMLEIWELHRRQHKAGPSIPLIIPIVVYHGKKRREPVRISDLMGLPDPELGRYVPDFELAFYDFSPESDEEIKGNIILRLVLSCFRAKNNPTVVRHVADIFGILSELDDSETSLRWFEVIAGYVLQTMDIDRDVMHNIAQEKLESSQEETIMTLAERLHREGKLEGRLEGEIHGRNAVLRRQLAKRFGQDILDIRNQERLRSATAEQLDLWAERILDAKTIEDVFRDS